MQRLQHCKPQLIWGDPHQAWYQIWGRTSCHPFFARLSLSQPIFPATLQKLANEKFCHTYCKLKKWHWQNSGDLQLTAWQSAHASTSLFRPCWNSCKRSETLHDNRVHYLKLLGSCFFLDTVFLLLCQGAKNIKNPNHFFSKWFSWTWITCHRGAPERAEWEEKIKNQASLFWR